MSPDREQLGIVRLDPQSRRELIDLLWDSLPPETPGSPPDWHLQELEQRIAAADANPNAAESWEQVLGRLSSTP